MMPCHITHLPSKKEKKITHLPALHLGLSRQAQAPSLQGRGEHGCMVCPVPMHHASFVRTAVNRDRLGVSTQGIDKKALRALAGLVPSGRMRCFTPKLFRSVHHTHCTPCLAPPQSLKKTF